MRDAYARLGTNIGLYMWLNRLLRVLRIARILYFVRALRTLCFSIVSTLMSLFWAISGVRSVKD